MEDIQAAARAILMDKYSVSWDDAVSLVKKNSNNGSNSCDIIVSRCLKSYLP